MRVLLCAVNYRTDPALADYLESIERAAELAGPGLQLQVLVVDNSMRSAADRIDFAGWAQRRRVEVTVESPERNLGYFGALPIAQAATARTRPDVVIFSNVDLTLACDFFALLALQLPSKAAVIAPAMLIRERPDFDQNPINLQRYSRWRLRVLRGVCTSRVLHAGYSLLSELKERFTRRRARIPVAPRDVYAAHGSLFIFPKPAFFLSLPRHEAFLFGEELLVAEETRRLGETTRYVPALRVFDSRHASIASLSPDRRRLLMRESLDFILRQYY